MRDQDRSFKSYYEDELEFLRGMGGEFRQAYPGIAPHLGLDGNDPDVLRLLEGFAFLTGRIRQSLDAEFPELLYPLMGQLWPHALRPTPAAAIVEFTPRPDMLREVHFLKQETLLQASVRIEGTICQFRTCYDLDVLPLAVEEVRTDVPPGRGVQLRLRLRALPGVSLARLFQPRNRDARAPVLRLHLHGSVHLAYGLYLWLGQSVQGIYLRSQGANQASLSERRLGMDQLKPVGWGQDEALLPYPRYSFAGYRHLHEYFFFPEKYLFFDLSFTPADLGWLAGQPQAERLEVGFDLRSRSDEGLSVSAENIRLNCVPAINLFPHPARPLSLDGTRTEYLVRPDVSTPDVPDHYDIFSVQRVIGRASGGVQRQSTRREFHPFFSFHRPRAATGEHPILYQLHLRPSVCQKSNVPGSAYPAVDTYLSFVDPMGEASTPATLDGTVSADLLVTNRDLPLRLAPSQLCKATQGIPPSIRFSGLGPISVPAPAPVGGDGLWRFFSHLLLGWDHLADPEALRGLLTLYHFPALYNQHARARLELLLEAIAEVRAAPEDRNLKGLGGLPVVVRGTHVQLSMHDARLAHPGELFLFGTAMSRFLAETATINTYSRLTLHGVDHGLRFEWEPQAGNQALI